MADIKNPQRRGFESSGEEPGEGDGLREQASELADKGREAAAAARDRVGEQAYEYAERYKHRLAEAINDIALSIREAGHKLHDEQQQGAASYVDTTADQVERMARYLEQHDVNELYERIEDTARRHPGVFLGATFATGLVAARFLRSSAERRRSHRQQALPMKRESDEQGRTASAATSMFREAQQEAGGSKTGGGSANSPSPSKPSGTSGPYPPQGATGGETSEEGEHI